MSNKWRMDDLSARMGRVEDALFGGDIRRRIEEELLGAGMQEAAPAAEDMQTEFSAQAPSGLCRATEVNPEPCLVAVREALQERDGAISNLEETANVRAVAIEGLREQVRRARDANDTMADTRRRALGEVEVLADRNEMLLEHLKKLAVGPSDISSFHSCAICGQSVAMGGTRILTNLWHAEKCPLSRDTS